MKWSIRVLIVCFVAILYLWLLRRILVVESSQFVRLSILVPAYNVEKYLSECLRSIQYQTFRDYEVIVVDDGSSDHSGLIADQFCWNDKRFRVIHNLNNTGLLLARKIAVQQANGQYCMFLDSDDCLSSKDSLRYIIQLLDREPADIIQFSVQVIGGAKRDRQCMIQYLSVYQRTIEGGRNILHTCFVDRKFSTTLWSKVYNMSVVKQVYAILPNTHLVIAEDICTSFLLQLYSQSFRGVRTKPIYSYRLGSGVSTQRMTLQTLKAFLDGESQALNIIYQLIPSDCIIECSEAYKSLFALFLESHIGRVSQLDQDDRIEAIRCMLYYYPPSLLSKFLGDSVSRILHTVHDSWTSHLYHIPTEMKTQ